MKRRTFLVHAAAAGSLVPFSGFVKRAEAVKRENPQMLFGAKGYGELRPTPSKNTGETFLSLPEGFEYNVFGKTGKVMSDGNKTPKDHDGMAAFSAKGEIRIVRNHEINDDVPKENVLIGKENFYDKTAGGGTTTLVLDPKTLDLKRDFVSLNGTLNNCAGGPTPWGSWISCEETTYGKTVFLEEDDDEDEPQKVGGFDKPHGYCFEVAASANSIVKPVPLKAMGRFSHEAVAFDKKRGIVYLTEDSAKSGFYRFLPKRFNRLSDGGVLQMLRVADAPNANLKDRLEKGTFTVSWVTIDNPDPDEADTNEHAVFEQGYAKGGALFKKLEGCFADPKGRIYFVDSDGGDIKGGRIWLYEPAGRNEGRLRLIVDSLDRELLDMPDNICLYPKSNLLFLCEDSDYAGAGGTPSNFVRALAPNGRIANVAKNIVPNSEENEFAGATFTPDGRVMFVNIQEPGITFAIWGDWENFRT